MSEGEYELKSTKYDKVGYWEIIKGILPQRNPQIYWSCTCITKKHSNLFVNIQINKQQKIKVEDAVLHSHATDGFKLGSIS